jgi:hypothetical protein
MTQITFAGLERWYVHIFEKVGWLILSINECEEKIHYHKYLIKKWLHVAKEKLNSEKINDSQAQDIIIMVENIIKLQRFIHKKINNNSVEKTFPRKYEVELDDTRYNPVENSIFATHVDFSSLR